MVDQISLLFHLFFLNLTCSCPYSYNLMLTTIYMCRSYKGYITLCHTAIENLSDPIGYLLDFTNPYYTALAGNMKARAKKDNSF